MRPIINILLVLFSITGCGLAKTYKGAELRTRTAVRYGRFEVRLQSTAGSGVISSFFTFVSEYTGVEGWNEIDLEWLGRYDDRVQFNTITPGQVNHDYMYFLGYNPNTELHEYAFEWTPVAVIWFVDGVQVFQQSYPADSTILALNRDQKIMMNIWPSGSTSWAGDFNAQILPVYAYYDWVKYYAFTPGQGNAGTNNDFTLDWTDNFDNFDSNRWEKATHTFDGNLCDFITQNCVFINGFMILCLTDAIATGFHGDPPVSLTADTPLTGLNNFAVLSAYPNPFNGDVQIAFELPSAESLQIDIFDLRGHFVRTLRTRDFNTGKHALNWDATDQSGARVAGGVYVVNLMGKAHHVARKLVYLP